MRSMIDLLKIGRDLSMQSMIDLIKIGREHIIDPRLLQLCFTLFQQTIKAANGESANTRNPRKAVWIRIAAHSSLAIC